MKKLIILTLSAAMLLAPVTAVLAQNGHQSEPRSSEHMAQAEHHRQMAEERVAEIKQQVEERHQQIRQEVCERRQATMQRVIPRLATNATALKTAIDTVYQRVQGFYESGQLSVENYDELKAGADAAQAEATTAVAAVESYEFELDCTNPNVARQLDGFRLAIQEAKDALKAYRVALVELISALRAEAAEANAQNEANGTNGQTNEGEE